MIEKERKYFIDIYLICLSTYSFGYAIFDLWRGFYCTSLSMFILSVLFLCYRFTSYRYRALLKVFLCLVLNAYIFYYSSYLGFDAGTSLYYFPLLLSLSLIFSFKKEKKQIAGIIFSIVLGIGINIFTNYTLFHDVIYGNHLQTEIFISNVICVTLFIILIFYFLYRKQKLIENYDILMKLKNDELIRIRSYQSINNELDIIIDLAIKNDPSFLKKFELTYPDFIQKITSINPGIVSSELELCAYAKLNFTTKEIAIYTNSTIRSIESKKYRIHKKLNINSDSDMNIWMNTI